MRRRGLYVITREENARLIRASGGRGTLALSFNTHVVWLRRDDQGWVESSWAVPLLEEWRGVTVNDGAGI